MELYLIRHGKTRGNFERRYIGATDEPLAPEGAALLQDCAAPVAQRIYASPMRRCLETAELLYPGQTPLLLDDLRESGFGAFERKTYEELKDEPAYRDWIASGGAGTPPGGEPVDAFKARCCAAFAQAVDCCFDDNISSAAFLVHGGTIMAILECFAGKGKPQRFYDWQTENGGGFFARAEKAAWAKQRIVTDVKKLICGRKTLV